MEPIVLTDPLVRARFVARPNRFVIHWQREDAGAAEVAGTPERGAAQAGALRAGAVRAGAVRAGAVRAGAEQAGTAYVSNSGRLGEILVPGAGVDVWLQPRPASAHRFEAVAATWQARWPGDAPRLVFLASGRINRVVESLLVARQLPGFAAWRLVRREPRVGRSRFDFLLARGGRELLLEVKSVTLTEHGVAMFPDAASERGTRHLGELTHLAEGGRATAALFVVQGAAERFAPDGHNDPDFARAFAAARGKVALHAVVIEPVIDGEGRLAFAGPPRPLPIAWPIVKRVAGDAGVAIATAEVDGAPEALAIAAPGGLDDLVAAARRPLSRPAEGDELGRLRRRGTTRRVFALRGFLDPCATSAALVGLGHGARVAGAACPRCPGHRVVFASGADPFGGAAFQRLLVGFRHAFAPPKPT